MVKKWKTPAPIGSVLEALRKQYDDRQKAWEEALRNRRIHDTDEDALSDVESGILLAKIYEEEKKLFGRIESALDSD